MLTGKTKQQFEDWYTQSYYDVESHWERTNLRLIEGFGLFPGSHKFIIISNFFISIGITIQLSRKWSNETFKYVCTVNGKEVELQKEEDLLFEERVQHWSLDYACKLNNGEIKQPIPRLDNKPLSSLKIGDNYTFIKDFDCLDFGKWEKGDQINIEMWHSNLVDREGNEIIDVLERCKEVV